jgi:transposase
MDRELIYQLYVVEKLSTRAIGEKYGLSRTPIERLLKKFNISLRNVGESLIDKYTPFRYYMSSIRRNIKTRGLSPTKNLVTLDDLKKQWEKQKGLCSYSGIQLKLYTLSKARYNYSMKSDLRHASLDRIDPTKGYETGNIQYICWPLNLAKNTMSHQQMKKFLKLICGS